MTPGDLERVWPRSACTTHPQVMRTSSRALLDEMVAQGLSWSTCWPPHPAWAASCCRPVDRLIRPGASRLPPRRRRSPSGVKAADILRVRAPGGSPDPQPGERCFMEADVETLSPVRRAAGFVGPELTLHSRDRTAMSRVAEAEIALIRSQLEGREETRDASVAEHPAALPRRPGGVLPAMLRMLDAVHRGHLVRVGRPLRALGAAAIGVQHRRHGDRVRRSDALHGAGQPARSRRPRPRR